MKLPYSSFIKYWAIKKNLIELWYRSPNSVTNYFATFLYKKTHNYIIACMHNCWKGSSARDPWRLTSTISLQIATRKHARFVKESLSPKMSHFFLALKSTKMNHFQFNNQISSTPDSLIVLNLNTAPADCEDFEHAGRGILHGIALLVSLDLIHLFVWTWRNNRTHKPK